MSQQNKVRDQVGCAQCALEGRIFGSLMNPLSHALYCSRSAHLRLRLLLIIRPAFQSPLDNERSSPCAVISVRLRATRNGPRDTQCWTNNGSCAMWEEREEEEEEDGEAGRIVE